MKGTTKPILDAFDGHHKTLFIPVYQRNYDWQIKQCERLFQDLEEIIAFDRPKHFFGAVVGQPETNWQWVVIDGQQRLTTVSILMLALAHALRDNEISSKDPDLGQKIEMDYLRVGSYKDETKFKLKPIKDDDAAYQRLFGPEKEFIPGSNITENYKFFRSQLIKTLYTADQIWKAIGSLEVMHLDLEPFDDAQRIFESLNSTGLELKESDKIRNYVLMGQESRVQTDLYEKRWNRIEKNSDFETDSFVRWYLTTKTSSTPKEQDVYEAFKAYVTKHNLDKKTALKDLYEYSGYFQKIRHATTGNAKVDRLLKRTNSTRGAVTIPFLMPLLREVENGGTTYADFYNVLKMIESFTTRRFVVGVATNSLNKIFATAFSEISKLRTEKQPYADIFAYSLLRRTGSGRFPTDAEFKEAFATKNMYSLRPAWRSYILDVLENGTSNDTLDIAKALRDNIVTVEHIMPQTLTEAWKEELGPNAEEIHETWLNRIGNLTVTGYNSSYSNSPFEVKKTMADGFDSTPYRLNEMVKAVETWGEDQMRERNFAFTNAALAYWETPTTTFEPPKAVLPVEPMGEDTSFTNREIVSFRIGDFQQTVESWAQMMPVLLAHMLRDRRTEIQNYVKDYGLLRFIRPENEVPNGWRRIDDSLMVFTANDTNSKLNYLRGLFDHLGIDPDELVFTLRVPKDASESGSGTSNSDGPNEEDKPSKYAALTKYLDELDESAELRQPQSDTEDLRKQFREDFAPFKQTEWRKALHDEAIIDYLSDKSPGDATEEEILAVISGILENGRAYLHEKIIDNTLGGWIRELDKFVS